MLFRASVYWVCKSAFEASVLYSQFQTIGFQHMQSGLNLRFSDPKIDFSSLSSDEDGGNYQVCLANISPAERRKRLRFGIIQFMISLVILGAMLYFDVHKLWRLTLILPFGAAAAGFLQWRDKT